ncbi:MAG: LysR family transcriptional regulator [Bacteriovoracaceae bacterium]|jgi:DNA-binding transcriptional LysR family regulator|nr:LysR family transcriptional regulator [Bacteriovoracaceae bacterium]
MLRSFVIFGGSANIYQAAKLAGISQPAMSQDLKVVEGYFDRTLFASE